MRTNCFVPPVVVLSPKGSSFAHGSRFLSARRQNSVQVYGNRPLRIAPACSENVPDKLVWVDAIPVSEIAPGQLERRTLVNLEICIACSTNGQVYALGNKGTPLGVPISDGTIAEIEGRSFVKCPQYGTLYVPETGEVKDSQSWIPSPPLLSNFIRALFPEPTGLPVYPVREQNGIVQVLLNVNAREQYEQTYWKGLLDASGKADGGYF